MELEKEKIICNIIPSCRDDRDLYVGNFLKNNTKRPEILDYRKDMLPVRFQGEQGSCAAMSCAAMKEWQEKKNIGLNEYLSAQFFYNNRSNLYDTDRNNDYGMMTRDVMKLLQRVGICLERNYRYGRIESRDRIPRVLYNEARQYVIKSYARVNTVEDLKQSLFENGPCLIAVPVYNMGVRMWRKNNNERLIGGHAMLICGYNDKGFIIRNSWGSGWGEGGYCIMPYEDFNLAYEYWTTVDDTNLPKKI